MKTSSNEVEDRSIEEELSLGIDDLFGDIGFDLHQIVSAGDETNVKDSMIPEEPSGKNEVLSEDGYILFDSFLLSYRKDETGLAKALVELSRRFSSYFCVVMLIEEGKLVPRYFVGLQEKKVREFTLDFGPYFGKAIRDSGQAVSVEWPSHQVAELSTLIGSFEISASNYPLFLPVLCSGQKGFIFLNVSEKYQAQKLLEILTSLGKR